MSVYVRCAARLANYRRRAILRAAGEFYKERAEGSGFVSLRRDKAYLCNRSGFVSLRRDKANGSPQSRCKLPQADPSSLCYAVASNIASSWRVLASRSLKECTFVLDRRVGAVKARQMPQDCSPYITMMPKTKANKATVSTIPQMVR